jgi:hypothetical protein
LGGILLLGSGCTYTQNRLRDLSDIAYVEAGAGVGVNLMATNWVQLGAGGYGPRAQADWLSLVTFGLGPEIGLGRYPANRDPYIPFLPFFQSPPAMGPSGEAGFAPIFYFRKNQMGGKNENRSVVLFRTNINSEGSATWRQWYDPKIWQFFPSKLAYEENYDRGMWDVGVSFYALIGGAIGVNLYEIVDFFTGLVFLDISGDDETGEPAAESAGPPPAGE